MIHDQQISVLLEGWEDVYKKGQLTLWVLLALYDKPRYMKTIKERIRILTNGAFSVDDNSMYRALKRYENAGLITHDLIPGDGGPDRKAYYLTDTGAVLLEHFVERNIRNVYYSESFLTLINGGKHA